MRPGDLAPGAAAATLAVLAALRAITADGPAVLDLDARPVALESAGRVLVEHPLADPGTAQRTA